MHKLRMDEKPSARTARLKKAAEIRAFGEAHRQGPLPRPAVMKLGAAPLQPATCAYTQAQLRAMEQLVLDVARTTVAQPGTLFSGDCKVRVLVALKVAQVGFAEVNAARAGRVVASPEVSSLHDADRSPGVVPRPASIGISALGFPIFPDGPVAPTERSLPSRSADGAAQL